MKKFMILFQKYKEIILYLVFGVLTTLVNIVTYYLCTRLGGFNEYISNVVAWLISVLFAFITNKCLVFESKNRTYKVVVKEALSFFLFRLLSLGIDMVAMYVMISLLVWNDLIAKIIANVVVIILNYVFSKLFVFHKRKEESV